MAARAHFDSNGFCRIRKGGKTRSSFQTIYERVFNGQYPPPLSPDGRRLYIGSWRSGLHCYDVSTGKVRWRKGPGRVRNIYAFKGLVLAEMEGRGLYLRKEDNGDLVRVISMSGISFVHLLRRNLLMAGPYRQKYLGFEVPKLQLSFELSELAMNPNGCLSFRPLSASLSRNALTVRGFEEYPNGNYHESGVRRFVRRIALQSPNKSLERTRER